MITFGFVSSVQPLSKAKHDQKRVSSIRPTVRAGMRSDAVAPVIRIVDTKFDGTSSVSLAMETIESSPSDASGVAGNASLGATLRRKKVATNLLSATQEKVPDGMAPKDFYFPPSTRNQAPVITVNTDSISVTYDIINPAVSGVSANSADSVAFWKQTPSKYSAPDTEEAGPEPEVISTELFENYFPTKIRNRAPKIELKAPRSADDPTGGYLTLESEYVQLNTFLASQLDIPVEDDVPSAAGATATAKYFPPGRIGVAPVIDIGEESVTIEMSVIESSESDAEAIRSSDALKDLPTEE